MYFRVVTMKNMKDVAKQLDMAPEGFELAIGERVAREGMVVIEMNTWLRKVAKWRESAANFFAEIGQPVTADTVSVGPVELP